MKLLLTWLLGVPALVAAMVLARAMSPSGMQGPVQVSQQHSRHAQNSCRQVQLDQMLAVVAQDGHRAACNRASVQ
jgi:hypothetical protein